jgi:hypothetical protein
MGSRVSEGEKEGGLETALVLSEGPLLPVPSHGEKPLSNRTEIKQLPHTFIQRTYSFPIHSSIHSIHSSFIHATTHSSTHSSTIHSFTHLSILAFIYSHIHPPYIL